MADNDKLCVFCQQIVSNITPKAFSHHKTLEDLRASAKGGCPTCMLFWDHLKDYGPKYATAMNFHIRGSHPVKWIGLGFEEMPGLSDAPYAGRNEILWYDHFTLVFCGTDVTEIPHQDDNTGGDQAWEVFKGWLKNCTTSHLKCPRNTPSLRMPTRCLDVGSLDDSYVRLQLSDRMMNAIAIADLPKTFQDAIAITRKLDIRYLWIDSLCIIQDSIEDWAAESSGMGDVYKNTFCNIAATAAPDGRTGCFLKREPLLARQCKIRISSTNDNGPLQNGIYNIVPNDLWKRGMSGPRDAPLNSRAWVVQERVLAPRVPHFGINQLFWERNELNVCESHPNGIPDTCFVEYEPSKFKNLRHVEEVIRERRENQYQMIMGRSPVTIQASSSSLDALHKWHAYVHVYSACHLTMNRDKLVAISAIAKELKPKVDSEYLAELWKRYLIYKLLWKGDSPPRIDSSRPTGSELEYCAPSWSWGSVDATIRPFPYIHYAEQSKTFLAQVLSAQVVNVTSGSTGQVSAGYLKVKGWLNTFEVETKSIGDVTCSIDAQGPHPRKLCTPPLENIVKLHRDSKWWFLPLLELWTNSDFMNKPEIRGLILVETAVASWCRRVGTFKARDPRRANFIDLNWPSFEVPLFVRCFSPIFAKIGEV